MTPNTIQFTSTDSEWIMRITADRRIEVNENVEVTEAAQKVLDAIQHLLAAQRNKLIEAEREECAKVLDEMAAQDKHSNYYVVAARAIRARSKS
jgi:hypothetical protein